jgi:photosystem II stability/assembly factor-like uncharacterized protein
MLVRVNSQPDHHPVTPFLLFTILILASLFLLTACGDGDNASMISGEIISGPVGPGGDDHDRPFGSLAIHPDDPNLVFVGTEANGFVKTTDGGNTWTRHRTGLKHFGDLAYPEIFDIAFASTNPDVMYAATVDSPGPVDGNYPSVVAGVYKSIDGGDSWQQMNQGLNNSSVASVLVDAEDENLVIIGVSGGAATFSDFLGVYFDGGIFRSSNGGNLWQRISIHANDVTNQYWNLIVRNSVVYSFGRDLDDFSNNLGFISSTDKGQSWTSFGTDLKLLNIPYFDVSADGNVIYAYPLDSFEHRKSINAGASWITYSNGAGGPVMTSPLDPDIVVFGGNKNLYYSDSGLVGAKINTATAAEFFDDIAFAPSDPTIVYAIARGYEFYRSDNSGNSFTLMKNIRSEVLNVIP